jgi:arsenate reductase
VCSSDLVTAFFKNTVKTLASEGFNFEIIDFSHQNPKYAISFEGTDKTIFGFSKLFNDAQNLNPFIAITTCNNADENCPFIPTATHRFHLPFVDPKFSDETEAAHKTYEKISQQIAGELFFMFTKVSDLLG